MVRRGKVPVEKTWTLRDRRRGGREILSSSGSRGKCAMVYDGMAAKAAGNMGQALVETRALAAAPHHGLVVDR
jgi:hypothetical protein